jgi:GxxExxY protein
MSAGNNYHSKQFSAMKENEISYAVRGIVSKVFNKLGPGLFESVYEAVLVYELRKAGYEVQNQLPLPVVWDEVHLDVGFRIDILVNNLVIIEIKSIENLTQVHHKQVITYLRLSGKKLGLLINFNCDDIMSNIFRKVNGL